MKTLTTALGVAALAALCTSMTEAQAPAPAPQAPSSNTFTLTGVTIHHVSGPDIAQGTIVWSRRIAGVHSPVPGRYRQRRGGCCSYTCGRRRPSATPSRSGSSTKTRGTSPSRYSTRRRYRRLNGVGEVTNDQTNLPGRSAPEPAHTGFVRRCRYWCAAGITRGRARIRSRAEERVPLNGCAAHGLFYPETDSGRHG